MRVWLWHHVDSLVGALARFARAPLASLFNSGVTGTALALPAGLHLAIVNLQTAAHALAPEPQLSLFLALEAAPGEAARVEARLKQHPAVREYRYVSRDQALADLKART